MGLVNTVVPLDRPRGGDGRLVPRDARALALRAAPAEGELQRRTRTGCAGIQQLAHDANLLFYGSEEARRAARPTRRSARPDFSQFPSGPDEPPRAPHRRSRVEPAHLAHGRAPAHAARGGRAGARRHRAGAAAETATFDWLAFVAALLGALFIQVGTNLSNDYSDARRGADTEDRLGPVRVTAGGLVPAAPGAASRPTCRFGAGRARAASTWSPSPAGSCSRSAPPRSSPACSTPAARGRTATRASARSSSSSSSASSRSPARTSCRREELPWEAFVLAVPVGLLASGDPRRQQRPRPRHRPARRQAHARRAARAATARARSTRRCSRPRSSPRCVPVRARVAVGVAAAPAG